MLHSRTPSLTRIVHICMSGVGGECGLEYDVCVCGLWIVDCGNGGVRGCYCVVRKT